MTCGWRCGGRTARWRPFGIGLGTVILAVNVVLLSSYTLGCHAMRHIAGGSYDDVSNHPVCDKAYACSSALNYKHQLFAVVEPLLGRASLTSTSDSARLGIWTDFRIL